MQWYKTTGMLIIAAAFGGLGSLAVGDTPDPVFWTWGNPDGDANGHAHIIRAVAPLTRVYNYGTEEWEKADPVDVAEYVIGAINGTETGWSGLDEGEICIILANLGTGHGQPGGSKAMCPALFKHWCDGVEHNDNDHVPLDCEDLGDKDVCAYWWLTPWMKHGAEDYETGDGCKWDEQGTQDWMEDFIAEYDTYQQSQWDFPDPTRFHFEAECTWWWDDWFAYAFNACKDYPKEPRWGDGSGNGEDIYGFDAGTSMYDLWNAADDEDWEIGQYDVSSYNFENHETDDWDDPWNQPWANWWTSTFRTAMDGAMEAACYDQIHNQWANTECSNYLTSCRIGSDYNYIPGLSWGAAEWVDVHWEGFGDLQAPVLYPVGWSHMADTGEHAWDATMRVKRHNIDTLIMSQPSYDPTEITPWIANVGATLTVRTIRNGCDDCDDTYYDEEEEEWFDCFSDGAEYAGLYCEEDDDIEDRVYWKYDVTKDDMRELLTMLRSRKLCEFIIWGGGVDEDDWDDLADVIDQVWMYDLDACSIATGINMNPQDCGDLEYAREGEYYTVNAVDVGNTYKVELQVEFTTSEASPANRFLTLFEAKMAGAMVPPTVNVTAQAYNYYTSHWDGLVMRSWDNELGTDDTKLFIADNGYILPTDIYVAGGRAKIRLVFESETDDPFTVNVDSAMLAEKAPTP